MIVFDLDIDNRTFLKTVNALDSTSDIIEDVLILTASFFERKAQDNINVSVYSSTKSAFYNRTGKARQSIIRQRINADTQRVFMGVDYGRWLEFGTGIPIGHTGWFTRKSNLTGLSSDDTKVLYLTGMEPRPFWMPAKKSTEQEVPTIFARAVKKRYST